MSTDFANFSIILHRIVTLLLPCQLFFKPFLVRAVTQDFLSLQPIKPQAHSFIHVLAWDADIRHVRTNPSLGELSQHVLKQSLLKASPPTDTSQHPEEQQNKSAMTASSVQHNTF